MRTFVSRSPEVEAMQLAGLSFEGFNRELQRAAAWVDAWGGNSSGVASAQPGDWIVRMSDTTFAVISAEDFASLYSEKADASTPAGQNPVPEVTVKWRNGVSLLKASQFLPPNGRDVVYAARFADWLSPNTPDVKRSQDGGSLYVATMYGPRTLEYGWWLVKIGSNTCVVESPTEFEANYTIISW